MQRLTLQFKTKKTWQEYLQEILYGLLKILALYLIILLVQNCIGGMAVVHGKSMEPTFSEGDYVIFRCIAYEPQRGDIVLCRTGKGYENELIKRIIGLPGDTVYIDQESGTVSDITYPVTVPQGQYFVLGDNRDVSLDSRSSEIGMLERKKIDGKVVFRIFPFSKIRRIK